MSEENPTPEELAAIKAKEDALTLAQTKADEVNKGRTGKGTRVKVGSTRGRNTQVISYEVFDETEPDTCPATLSEFMELTKIEDEKVLVSYLIEGFNSNSLSIASDPIAEFLDPSWTDEIKKGFKTVVKTYAANLKLSIEDAVALIKPAYLASLKK